MFGERAQIALILTALVVCLVFLYQSSCPDSHTATTPLVSGGNGPSQRILNGNPSFFGSEDDDDRLSLEEQKLFEETKDLFLKELLSIQVLKNLLQQEQEQLSRGESRSKDKLSVSALTAKLPRLLNTPDSFRDAPPVEVLLWTGYTWTDLGALDTWKAPNYLGHDIPLKDCGLKCNIGPDKNRAAYADAVLFEAQPLAGFLDDYLRREMEIPQKRPGQFWVNMGYEQPHYFQLYGHTDWISLIDINMTYWQKSQVPITLTCSWGGGNLEDFLVEPQPKSKLIAWFGTNCHGGGGLERANFMKELMKYIKVDSFGQCHHTADLPEDMRAPIYNDHGLSMRNKVKIFREYKFVLALENNNVTDYVTEKIVNALQAGSVPVYMGSPTIDDWIPGDHSIIRTDSFENPKQLAEYLMLLDSNDKLYQEYFAWKKIGLSERFIQKYQSCVFYSANCRLCQKVHEFKEYYKLLHSIPSPASSIKQSSSPFFGGNADAKTPVVEYLSSSKGINPSIEFMKHNSFAMFFPEGAWMSVANSERLLFSLDKPWSFGAWVIPASSGSDVMTLIERGSGSEVGSFQLNLVKTADSRKIVSFSIQFCFKDQKLDQVCEQSGKFQATERWTYISVGYVASTRIQLAKNSEVYGVLHFLINTITHLQVPISTPLPPTTPDSPLAPWYIGGKKNNFRGKMDDLSVWQSFLDLAAINKIRYMILRGDENHLIAYWSFNEGEGEVVFDHTSNALNAKFEDGIGRWGPSPTKPLILRKLAPIPQR